MIPAKTYIEEASAIQEPAATTVSKLRELQMMGGDLSPSFQQGYLLGLKTAQVMRMQEPPDLAVRFFGDRTKGSDDDDTHG